MNKKRCLINYFLVFYTFRLLLYGVVCTLAQRNEAAETFFEAATCVDPKSILAWTMLGLYMTLCSVLPNTTFYVKHFNILNGELWKINLNKTEIIIIIFIYQVKYNVLQ